MSLCPQCGAKGRSIGPVTLRAQVLPERLAELRDQESWRLCTSGDCEVVYFHDAEEVVFLSEIRTVPFHKSEDADRLVCFCFGHSVADLEADLAANGTSTIQAAIKAACKEGRDDCERKNPQGRCCLGNVGQILKREASDDPGEDSEAPGVDPGTDADEACCSPEDAVVSDEPATRTNSRGHSGLVASGGAFLAAVLSSACCWLPLAALGFGASAAGLGAFMEAWRLPLVFASMAFLGTGFWLVYREPRCAPGDECEVRDPRRMRWDRGMMWLTALLVAVVAFFPEYVGAFAGGEDEVALASPGGTTTNYRVEGMTCAGCEGHARESIEAIPGVVSAVVSYRSSTAEVVWSSEPDDAAVASALSEIGYRSSPMP